MSNLSIGLTSIRQTDGLYNLNDLHAASGKAKKHQPALYLRLSQAKELISELVKSTDLYISNPDSYPVKKSRGTKGGTFVCKELVYAYAMWISPKFHLHVIRAFDAIQNVAKNTLPATCTPVGSMTFLTTIINGQAVVQPIGDDVILIDKQAYNQVMDDIKTAAYDCSNAIFRGQNKLAKLLGES